MNVNQFMKNGIDHVLKTAGRFYLKDREGRAFLSGILPQMAQSAQLREQNEARGVHVPAFLIASVASRCNLHCTGCYARAAGPCHQSDAQPDLTAGEWARLFDEAAALGVSFILLAGGEPLTRPDVLAAAANRRDVVFPVFTNGTLLDEHTLSLFETNRNLIPIFSVEGGPAETDARRGAGTYAKMEAAMAQLAQKRVLSGVSITVTKENKNLVCKQSFLANLRKKGCGIAIFVEYVPAETGTDHLVLNEEDLAFVARRTAECKRQLGDMVILSFPGDEAAMGGCLASGRGFFHINPKGGAEPCPFSPHAKHNLKDTPMTEVLRSGYFEALRDLAAEAGTHTGGCVLFQKEHEVLALLSS